MFEKLIRRVRETTYRFASEELFRANDPYRLVQVLTTQADDLGHLLDEANQLVKELEKLDTDALR